MLVARIITTEKHINGVMRKDFNVKKQIEADKSREWAIEWLSKNKSKTI